MSLSQGSDAILDQKLGYQAYNRLKNHFIKATDPGDLQNGMIWFDSTNQKWYGKKTAGLVDMTPASSAFPEGTIIPWVGGYFTNGANAGYTRVMGASNDATGVNALLNASGWYVCDGAALNLPTSTIYDGVGRYLPNLTDDRFLMGDNAVGGIGGSSSSAHTHGAGTLAGAAEDAHTHGAGTVGAAAHTHAVGTLAAATEDLHKHGAGTIGAAAHTHAVGTLAVASEATHTHSVDPPSVNTSSEALHTHAVNPPSTASGGASDATTGGSSAANSGGPSATANFTVTGGQAASYNHTHTIAHTHEHAHTHAVDILSFDSGVGSSHNHSVNIGPFASAAGSSHTHGLAGVTASADPDTSGTTAVGSAHTHVLSGATASADPDVSGSTAAGSSHNHAISGDSGAASATENRPAFLAVIYLQYVLAA